MEKEKENKKRFEELFLQKGYKKLNSAGCYQYSLIPAKSNLPNFLLPNIGYRVDRDGYFSAGLSICIYSKDDIMHYLFGNPLGKIGIEDLGLGWEFINNGDIVHKFEYRYMQNRLHLSYRLNDFEKFYKIFKGFEQKLEERYSNLDNIITDQDKYLQIVKELNDKQGMFKVKRDPIYRYRLDRVALYKFFDEKDRAIKELEGFIEQNDKDDMEFQRYKIYLDYLKNGTPLKYIPSPHETASILRLTDEDIYLFLNKKTTKDKELLDYFGGADKFEKAKKIEHEQMQEANEGIAICKAGKWTILRLGFEILMQFDKEELETILKNMSEQYNRVILFINQDTTNTFGFEVYKKGDFLRRWMAGDGEVLENIGKPITGERKKFTEELKKEQDAESVKKFLDTLLKITYADLEKSKCVAYNLK